MSQEKYDVIVVGAGIAGLFCANFLARFGKKTLLLEHNHQPGGLMGGFIYLEGSTICFENSHGVFLKFIFWRFL